jgi:tetratricopeptide (TPR) repeat protein
MLSQGFVEHSVFASEHDVAAVSRLGTRGITGSHREAMALVQFCQTLFAVSASEYELVSDLRSAGDPERVARSAKALVIRADALLEEGSADEALKVLDTVIDALDGSADLEPRKVLVLTLATKSATLKRLGRKHAMRPFEAMVSQYGNEAVDVFDEEARRLWSAEESQDRERLAWVLLTEAMILEHQGRRADAGATLRALLKRFDDDESSPAITPMLDAARHALEMYRKYRWQPPW